MMNKIIQAILATTLIWTIIMLPVFGVLMFKAGFILTGLFITIIGGLIWIFSIFAIIHEIILKR
jgi:hypothetical protein